MQTCHGCTLPEVSPCLWTSTATLSCHRQLGPSEPAVPLWQLESGLVVHTCPPHCVSSVLVSAAKEFLSFPGAVTELWFGFGMRTGIFQLGRAAHAALLARGLGACKSPRGCSQDSRPQLARRISHSTWQKNWGQSWPGSTA